MATNAEHQAAFRKRRDEEVKRLRALVKAQEKKIQKLLDALLKKL